MTFRPSHPSAKDPVASNEDHNYGARSVRGQPSAWGLPPPRRGLTPLSTNVNSFLDSAPTRNSTSASPFTASFSSVLNNFSNEESLRGAQTSAAARNTLPPIQAGSQQSQSGQVLLSPRSRAITPSSAANSISSAATSTATSQVAGGGSGGGGGGGGGGSRNSTFSPPPVTSPTGITFDRSPFGGGSSSSTSSQSSVSKIVTTQIFLLLGSITEKEGKAKWESQAEAIRKLVESNGMENFPKYFRRLVQGNAPQIFPGINRNVENAGNYQMLVQEMNRLTEDPTQASRIAEALDTGQGAEGDVFRDFDVTAFVNHFKLTSYAKILLSDALIHAARPDLRNKALNLLRATFDRLLVDFTNSRNDNPEISPSLLATCAYKYVQNVPEASKNANDVARIQHSLRTRYHKLQIEMPSEVSLVMVLLELIDRPGHLVKEIQQRAPNITSDGEAAAAFVSQLPDEAIDEIQIAHGSLFMILAPEWQEYKPSLLLAALHKSQRARRLQWQAVFQGFDYKGLEITKPKFLLLLAAFLPLAKIDPEIDIQALWGGRWRFDQTQTFFLRAYLSCSPSELDATTIPRLRQAYDPLDSADGPNDSKTTAERALHDPIISLDAVQAVMNLIAPAKEGPSQANTAQLMDILNEKAGFLLCSLSGIPTPWSSEQDSIMSGLFKSFLNGNLPEYSYVLHTMWKQAKSWVALRLVSYHLEDPLDLVLILDKAQEMGWTEDLLTLVNGFGIDLAALAFRKGFADLDSWLREKSFQGTNSVINAISKFLVLKAQDELRTSREEQPQPRTVSLSMKTVYDMLALLDEHSEDRAELKALQRQCLQAYPRLIIYCEGISENVDVECTESNNLPRSADVEMQDLYKRMYNGELNVQSILEYLQECKASEDSSKVDLFACMIHGLFDEYSCFGEYPLSPLATTAVLFGGILQVRLISDLTLRVGQEMVLDAVRDFSPEEKMYKFGLQALIHVVDRFQEPEWLDYCAKLIKIPGLRSTQAYNAALQALNQARENGGLNGLNGLEEDLDSLDGNVDSILPTEARARFKAIDVETLPPAEEPDEATQEKVVFFFNNVTEQNVKVKIGQIEGAVSSKYQQWFAHSLVEGRAKLEPNNQSLYITILDILSIKMLWNEVLRQTLVSVQRLLNAESTLQSSPDRKQLKNLSAWLGSLTLARDKPIKHKDIAFLDLLVEGYHMQKSMIVVPFTCNVLVQGVRSKVFKPPNPWVVEVIAALMELYKEADIKINLKFEIEVLLREFGLDVDSIPPSMNLRLRRFPEEDIPGLPLSDGADNFDENPLVAIGRGTRTSRFDVDLQTLPDLSSILIFPPPSGSVANQARLRQIVQESVKRAIIEIVAPVVERSVTIATIATTSLIHKDFATESDEDRVRRAAHQMVRQLSGSLALVTCKEPLKMSMTNYIRMAQAELPEQAVPEGAILMCVNDNLDVACSIVEQQAEERSMPEIDAHIEGELAQRRRHLSDHPSEAFLGESFSRWSGYIPEPYKQAPGGLNPEQMAIYLDFARQSRGQPSHAQTASADSGRQLPDVLQEAFSGLPNVHGTSDSMSMPHQTPQQSQHPLQSRMLPPPLANSARQPQTNGYLDAASYDERIQDLMSEIRRVIQEGPAETSSDQQRNGALFDLLNQIWDTIDAAPETAAMNCAENICKTVYSESMMRQEVEIFVRLLSKLYETYPAIRTEVTDWARGQDDERFLTTDVTVALIRFDIVQLRAVDAALTRLIFSRGEVIIEYVSDLMEALVLNKRPLALRSDFAGTMGALSSYHAENPSSLSAKDIIQRLKEYGLEDVSSSTIDEQSREKEQLLKYVFSEWTRLCESYPGILHEKQASAFVAQLVSKKVVGTQEQTALFLRVTIDGIVDRNGRFDMTLKDVPVNAFSEVDWLARLLVVLVKNHSEIPNAASVSKASYMDSLLSLVTLVMNNQAVTRAEHFSQRIFFRMWSSILCDWHEYGLQDYVKNSQMLLVFAENILAVGPVYFPSFLFGWLSLISHRFLMPALLRLHEDKGYDVFCRILSTALSYIGALLKPQYPQSLAAELYRAVLRILLILHHDFPEFLVENHFRLCNSIPPYCTQLFNLVLSAYPSSLPELPNPFVIGLKADRLEEMRRPPSLANDYLPVLKDANVLDPLNAFLQSKATNDISASVNEAVSLSGSNGQAIDRALIHAIAIHIGEFSVARVGSKTSQPFNPTAPAAVLISSLCNNLSPPARLHFINAMTYQLRYPNSHTHYFSSALLHLFKPSDSIGQSPSEVPSIITRTLLERLHVVKPHPWGLVCTILELLKNPEYAFWGQGFLKDLPAVGALFGHPLLKNYED